MVICEYPIALFEVILFEYKFIAGSDLIIRNPNSSPYTQCHSINEMHTEIMHLYVSLSSCPLAPILLCLTR